MATDFITAVRGLLLPTTPGASKEIEARVKARLLAIDVPEEDHARWLKAEQRGWFESGQPSQQLKTLVKIVIFDTTKETESFSVPSSSLKADGMLDAVERLATRYFETHKKLVVEQLLENEVAHQLLSHAGTIIRMRLLDRMSASEIARWITAADTRQPTSWKSIQYILQEMRCDPKISQADAMSCFQYDTDMESGVFGDQTNAECIDYISGLAADLGVHGDIGLWLNDLTGEDNHPPYVVMLHYRLTIQNFFDHALSYLYEFTPRGAATIALKEKYVEAGSLHIEGNPFLNNAKAVERADFNWVLAKKDNKPAVRALSGILMALEGVGPAVKSDLCSLIRQYLCRLLRLKREAGSPLASSIEALTEDSLTKLVTNAAKGNSGTTGILEQRLVEIWASAQHDEDWSVRGIGDSVFAANTFRRKFGDCEFELPVRPEPKIIAYEAHGGKLTAHYVNDHIYTFGRVLEKRSELMKSISPLEHWSAEVIFVAHSFDDKAIELGEFSISDKNGGEMNVGIKYKSFAEIAGEIVEAGIESANSTLLPLNTHLVHPSVREKINALIED